VDLVVEGRAFVKGALSRWCIGIEDGRIAAVAKSLRGDEHIDLHDMLVLPAAIDPHVHFRDPGLTAKEDFHTGTMAAAFGGVGTVLDMPNTLPPVTTPDALAAKKDAIKGRAWVDYGLLAGTTGASDMEGMSAGSAAFKMFMGSSTGGMLVSGEADVRRIASESARLGRVLSVHAEEEGMLVKKEERSLEDHLRNRPAAAEAAAISRVRPLGGHINICHVSSALGLRASEGMLREATVHHMLLDASNAGGAYAKVNPPLRTRGDRDEVLRAFLDGRIAMLGSDHAPHSIEDKEQEFHLAPSGMPGVETSVPILLAMVKRGALPLDRFVAATSANAARAFGLNKGSIEVGRDADLMVVDASAAAPIKIKNLHSKCGWSLFEGREAIFPRALMVRGAMAAEDGSLAARPAGRDVAVGGH